VWIRNQTKKEMSDIKKFRKNGVPRLPVALGSSPELSAFTMSLALPVFRDFFWFGIHTASVPSTAETHTGGGAVLGKSEGSPARRHSRK